MVFGFIGDLVGAVGKYVSNPHNWGDLAADVGIAIVGTAAVAAGGWAVLPALMLGGAVLKTGFCHGWRGLCNMCAGKNWTDNNGLAEAGKDFMSGAIVAGLAPFASFAGSWVGRLAGGRLATAAGGQVVENALVKGAFNMANTSLRQRITVWGARRFTEGFTYGFIDNGSRAGYDLATSNTSGNVHSVGDVFYTALRGGIFNGFFNMATRGTDLKSPPRLTRAEIGQRVVDNYARRGVPPSLSPRTRAAMAHAGNPHCLPSWHFDSNTVFGSFWRELGSGFTRSNVWRTGACGAGTGSETPIPDGQTSMAPLDDNHALNQRVAAARIPCLDAVAAV